MLERDGVRLADTERQPCEIWTRVMGYHRPVSNWNTGKIGEFEECKYFTEAACRRQSPAAPMPVPKGAAS